MKASTKLIWGLLVIQLALHIHYTIKVNTLEDQKFQCERERTRDLRAVMSAYNEFAEEERAFKKFHKKMDQRKVLWTGGK